MITLLAVGVPAMRARAQTAHFSYVQTTVATGLNTPQGLAVDASGNVYIADLGNNRVVKETLSAGTYTQSVVHSGLIYAYGVALDASGNVYIADGGQQGILEETLSAGTYSANPTVIGNGFRPLSVAATSNAVSLYAIGGNGILYHEAMRSPGSYTQNPVGSFALPEGVAVDSRDVYIYVVNRQNGEVQMGAIVSGTYSGNAIVTGLSAPTDVAVDGSGNVYVVDQGANTVYKETPPSGTGTYTQSVVATDLSAPYGVAVDASGAIYVSDAYGGGRVLKLVPGAVSLGTQNIGSTSPPQPLTFTFDTAGTLGSYAVLTEGATGLDFLDSGGGSCQAGAAYAAGAICTVNVTLTPKAAGARYGAVTLYNTLGVPFATAYLNGVGTGPQIAFSPSTQTSVGSGTDFPLGVVVDGGGNVYIADTSHNRVLKGQTPVITGLNAPYGVTVDGGGNLYIADTYYHPGASSPYGRVLKETLLSTGSYTQSVIADGTTSPYPMDYPNGVAVDGSGNVYISNTNANQILKETLLPSGGYMQSLVADATATPNALNFPKGVAVDGSGNVYVANTQSYQVLKETPSASGAYTQGLVAALTAGGYDSPFGVAVDGTGNVYYTDAADNKVIAASPTSSGTYVETRSWTVSDPFGIAVDSGGNVLVTNANSNDVSRLDVVDPPSLTFAATRVGITSSDSPQTVTVTNIGNAALSFTVPGTAGALNPGIAPNFSYGASSTCTQTGSSSASFMLAAGDSCTELISFSPQTAGAISGSVVSTDDNLNATNGTQAIALNGTATAGAPTVTVAASSAPYGSSNVTVTAAVSYGGTPPTGAVTFTLAATPGAQQAATCSSSSGTRTCTATYNVATLQAGTYSLSVSEAADGNYSAASGSGSVTITQAMPAVTVAPQSIVYGTAQTVLVSNIAYTGSTAPSGAVIIAVDTGAAVTAICSGAASPLTCTASYASASLTAGSHTIRASIAADANYFAASGTGTLSVAQAVPSITWATPASVPVGTLLSSTQLDAASSVAGTFVYMPPAGTVLAAGSETLSATFTPTDATDYTTATKAVALTVVPFAAAPSFIPGNGAYTSPQTVVIADATPGAVIYYTVDGSTPTALSPMYTAPISVASSETIKAIATAANYGTSPVASATLTIYSAPVCSLTVQGTSTALSVLALANCTDPQGQALTSTLNWGDGTSSPAAARNTHTYTGAGTYTVTLTSVDTVGLETSVRQQITPNQTPQCSLGFAQGAAATYAMNVAVSCTDPQNQPLSLSIDWGDGSQTPATNNAVNAHTYANPSASNTMPYLVNLTAVDSSGLIGSSTQPVTILPAAPQVSPGAASQVSASAQPPAGVPDDTQVTFICASVSTTVGGSVVLNALPAQYGITCSAPTVSLSSAQSSVTVSIQTTSASATTTAHNHPSGSTAVYYAIAMPLPTLASLVLGLMARGFPGRRRRQAAAASMIVLACFAMSSCGGSFTPPPVVATPVGTYYITIVEVAVTTPAPTGFVQTSLIVPLPIGLGGS